MPSPFPGMDPYLEGREWRSFHTQFSVQIGRQLVPQVRPKYFVRTEKVYVLESTPEAADTAGRRVPDVSVLQTDLAAAPAPGSTATLDPPLHLRVAFVEEVPQVTVEIYDLDDRSLVTAIEVLSPTNKDRFGRGDYLAKRQRFLQSDTHLLEIDLLRTGRRLPMTDPIPATDYCVLLSRADRRPVADVWPVSVRQRLPAVPIPLLPGDPDVSLDLQAALTSVYDDWAYDLELDYRLPAPVPLAAADAAWAAGLLAGRLQ